MRDRLASGGPSVLLVEEKNDEISLIERPADEFRNKHCVVHAEKRDERFSPLIKFADTISSCKNQRRRICLLQNKDENCKNTE